jgi:hypothetical protein
MRLRWWFVVCLLSGACTSSPGGGASGQAGAAGMSSGAGSGAVAGSGGGATAGTSGGAGSGATAGSAGGGAAGASGGAGSGAAVGADGGAAGAGESDGGAAGTGVDAGGMGGFGFSGLSRCASAGTLLCESFEDGLDANVWTQLISGEGTVTVDGTRAFRGSKSLHVNVVNAGHKAAISETKTFPITNNIVFARMFVWFDTFTTGAHFTMAEAPQTAAGAWIRFGGQGGKYGVGTDHGASGDWLQQDTAPVPTKQWTCIEFEFKSDTNEFHVWLDDVERTALNVGAKQHPGFVMPPFTSLWFGWQTYSNQAPGELWIDEIAIDSKPIGCAR